MKLEGALRIICRRNKRVFSAILGDSAAKRMEMFSRGRETLPLRSVLAAHLPQPFRWDSVTNFQFFFFFLKLRSLSSCARIAEGVCSKCSCLGATSCRGWSQDPVIQGSLWNLEDCV